MVIKRRRKGELKWRNWGQLQRDRHRLEQRVTTAVLFAIRFNIVLLSFVSLACFCRDYILFFYSSTFRFQWRPAHFCFFFPPSSVVWARNVSQLVWFRHWNLIDFLGPSSHLMAGFQFFGWLRLFVFEQWFPLCNLFDFGPIVFDEEGSHLSLRLFLISFSILIRLMLRRR